MASLKRLFVLFVLAALIPTAGTAQDLSIKKIDLRTSSGGIRLPSRLPDLLPARNRTDDRSTARLQAAPKPKRHAMGWAIAIGIGAGVGAAGIAASKYGKNEGGALCTRCFAQWSAIAIPVGAGAGAAVGYLIDRARR